MEKFTLGRGISTLLGEGMGEDNLALMGQSRTLEVAIENLFPNPNQPRRYFDSEKLDELTESIRHQGILQPILVRPHPSMDFTYEIIAGERRWQAAVQAKLATVPVIVRELTEEAVIEISMIENIQRENLNPIEEASGYRMLIDKFDYTQEKLSRMLSRSRSHIANTMRLLTLPDDIQRQVISGALTSGHARALIGLPRLPEIAAYVIDQGLTVREVEQLAQDIRDNPDAPLGADSGKGSVKKGPKIKNTHLVTLQQQLSEWIGLNVKIQPNARGTGGKLVLQYDTLEEFDQIRNILKRIRDSDQGQV